MQISDRFIENLRDRKEDVDACLQHLLAESRDCPASIHEAMEYSLLAGGKRIRPILCLMAYEIFAPVDDSILRAACALEYIHTYTLIHDDLPCMDDDDLRRGKPTLHRAFSEGLAVLAGDALLTEAFYILAQAMKGKPSQGLGVISDLASLSGHRGVIAGQVLDLEYENKKADEWILEDIHTQKTAKLIMASVRMGGWLAGADHSSMEALTEYGKSCGLAFQILDDILDATGCEKKLGKKAGQDEKHQKVTFPRILGLEASRERLQEKINLALSALDPFKEKAENLSHMALYLGQREN